MASNPVDEFLEAKTAAANARKGKEIQLWHDWNTNGRQPEHLKPLLKAYQSNVNYKASRSGWRAPNVPESAFRAELQGHLIRAFESFDPTRGVALNTHVEQRLQKAKRYNNRFQNLAYIPEGQSSQIGKIDLAHNQLTQELGRAPTHTEIADHLGIPVKRVDTIQRARRRDIPSSALESDTTPKSHSYEQQQIHVASNIIHELYPNDPDLVKVFHYTFGTQGHPQILSTGELAKKLGKSESQVSRLKTRLGNDLANKMGLRPQQT